MKIQFTLYAGNKEYKKVMEFADTADESEIEQAFDDWRAGFFTVFGSNAMNKDEAQTLVNIHDLNSQKILLLTAQKTARITRGNWATQVSLTKRFVLQT